VCGLVKVFHKPVPSAKQGDRVGMCVTQLDSKLLERGLAATPGSVVTMTSAIAALRRIKYFKQPILNRTKFHGTCHSHSRSQSQRTTRTQ
jgi:selenocysteine-specific elongation factor